MITVSFKSDSIDPWGLSLANAMCHDEVKNQWTVRVISDLQAAREGVRSGDVIVALDGVTPDPSDSSSIIDKIKVGKPCEITFWCGGHILTTSFKDHRLEPWGLHVPFSKNHWSIMVKPGKQAELLGIKNGDRILAFNGRIVCGGNRAYIKTRLCDGEPCIITFGRHSTLLTRMNGQKEPTEKKTEHNMEIATKKNSIQHDLSKKKNVRSVLITIEFKPCSFGIKFMENVITHINPGSQAELMGVRVGWEILTVNDREYVGGDMFKRVCLQSVNVNKPTTIVFRTGYHRTIAFEAQSMGIAFEGRLVKKIKPNSPADKLGVRAGWNILEVNGKVQANNQNAIKQAVNKTYQNSQPSEILFSTGKMKKVSFPLGRLGLAFGGRTVKKIQPNSPADIAGIREGWNIIEVNGVPQPDDKGLIKQAIEKLKASLQTIEILFSDGELKKLEFKRNKIGLVLDGNTVKEILPDSIGSNSDVRVGWKVLEVNGEKQNNSASSIGLAINKTFRSGSKTHILFSEELGRKTNPVQNHANDAVPIKQPLQKKHKNGSQIKIIVSKKHKEIKNNSEKNRPKDQSDAPKKVIHEIHEREQATLEELHKSPDNTDDEEIVEERIVDWQNLTHLGDEPTKKEDDSDSSVDLEADILRISKHRKIDLSEDVKRNFLTDVKIRKKKPGKFNRRHRRAFSAQTRGGIGSAALNIELPSRRTRDLGWTRSLANGKTVKMMRSMGWTPGQGLGKGRSRFPRGTF